jgi:hypothetical protein
VQWSEFVVVVCDQNCWAVLHALPLESVLQTAKGNRLMRDVLHASRLGCRMWTASDSRYLLSRTLARDTLTRYWLVLTLRKRKNEKSLSLTVR